MKRLLILSTRYVTERFLPDKAIDLIDESASRVRMYRMPQPADIEDAYEELRNAREERDYAVEKGQTDVAENWNLRETEIQQRLDQMRVNSTQGEGVNVTAEDIAEVLSMWTGIPVYQFTEEESARLLRMEEELRKHIVGQEEAIEAIAKQYAVLVLA